MRKLSVLSETRDNNFNLIRAGAAVGVFISHCFPLAGFGIGGKSQLLGYLSLNTFFIISGFLVTRSFFFRGDVLTYLRSRALRIFPGLFLALLYTVFIVGAIFTTLPYSAYMSDSLVYEYTIKNVVLFLPDTPSNIPGVFLDSKYRPIANAPLWSLPYEVACYISLMLLALVTRARNNITIFRFVTVSLLLIFFIIFVANYVSGSSKFAIFLGKESFRLGAMFMVGVVLYLARNKIIISHRIMMGLALIILMSTFYKPIFVVFTYACLGYFVLYLAYIPNGIFREFNKLGDYSYGIYIFGYPTQQALEQITPNLDLLQFFIISFSITLALAILSWHMIESRALSYK